MPIKGFIPLQTPKDLLAKLEHDLGRMEADPTDAYAAFDFFVTAEHVLDWLHPDSANGRQAARSFEISIRYFKLCRIWQAGRSTSTGSRNTTRRLTASLFPTAVLAPRASGTASFSPGSFEFAGITIKLTTGESKFVVDLAKEVYEFWRGRLT